MVRRRRACKPVACWPKLHLGVVDPSMVTAIKGTGARWSQLWLRAIIQSIVAQPLGEQASQMSHFSLSSWLLVCAAVPIWLSLIVIVPQSTGWGGSSSRFCVAPFVLAGITIAIRQLLRGRRNAWPLSALLAAVIALGSLSVLAWWLSN
jgi:hypothetical protein